MDEPAYRPIPDDERDRFLAQRSYAFDPESGPYEHDPDALDPEMGARRGLYRGDDLLCSCRHYWLTVRLRGAFYEAAGLSSVASPPEHRRSGHVRTMLHASLEEYRERGLALSLLWAFSYGFYRRLGWDTCNRVVWHELDPEVLSFASKPADSSYRRIEPDESDVIAPVYEADAFGYSLAIDRTERWWRRRVLTGWDDDRFTYAWERAGEPRGYVVYRFDSIGDGLADRRLEVTDLAAVDHEALLAIFRFLSTHDSQVSSVHIPAPSERHLLDAVERPDDVETTVESGPMARVVDVEALTGISVPNVESSVTIALRDPLVEWNEGTFRFEVHDGRLAVERTSAPPDVRTDVAALSQLVVGFRSARALAHLGRLQVDNHSLRRLQALFPSVPVCLWDFF